MITPGTILIDHNVPRPGCFELRTGAYPAGWMRVVQSLSPREMEDKLSCGGWTFFYIAIAIKKTAFGLNQGRMIEAALRRIIAAVQMEGCNCVQIDRVKAHRFLGLPCISVSAHPRHVQRDMIFKGR